MCSRSEQGWRVTVVLAALGVAPACSAAGQYSLSVQPPDGLEVALVEVQVVAAGCADVPWREGLEPEDAIQVTRRRRAMPSEPVGDLPLGEAHFYARAFDEECRVVASGCTDAVLLETGGEIRIELMATDGPTCGSACDPVDCTQASPRCGDGLLGREACDDANEDPGDGCDACRRTPGYGCSGEPSLCAPRPLAYGSSAHTHVECIALGGEVVAVSGDPAGSEVCRLSAPSFAVDQRCPGGWAPAAQWSRTRGCSSPDGNFAPAPDAVVCGVPVTTPSGLCANNVCTDGMSPYSVAEHGWSNAAVEEIMMSRGSGGDAGNATVQWDGASHVRVGGCTGDTTMCPGSATSGYLRVRARVEQIGCE